ncbi:unnamed protein product [Thelazia callipaeda]|uniref:DUF4592 domain-containing protein n=1 Tax=Thelazia callipaeda TaxID=103827 RepID=A0A0N5CM42_THECL|nr:unnamed protein product [Thelazia callipaeda]
MTEFEEVDVVRRPAHSKLRSRTLKWKDGMEPPKPSQTETSSSLAQTTEGTNPPDSLMVSLMSSVSSSVCPSTYNSVVVQPEPAPQESEEEPNEMMAEDEDERLKQLRKQKLAKSKGRKQKGSISRKSTKSRKQSAGSSRRKKKVDKRLTGVEETQNSLEDDSKEKERERSKELEEECVEEKEYDSVVKVSTEEKGTKFKEREAKKDSDSEMEMSTQNSLVSQISSQRLSQDSSVKTWNKKPQLQEAKTKSISASSLDTKKTDGNLSDKKHENQATTLTDKSQKELRSSFALKSLTLSSFYSKPSTILNQISKASSSKAVLGKSDKNISDSQSDVSSKKLLTDNEASTQRTLSRLKTHLPILPLVSTSQLNESKSESSSLLPSLTNLPKLENKIPFLSSVVQNIPPKLVNKLLPHPSPVTSSLPLKQHSKVPPSLLSSTQMISPESEKKLSPSPPSSTQSSLSESETKLTSFPQSITQSKAKSSPSSIHTQSICTKLRSELRPAQSVTPVSQIKLPHSPSFEIPSVSTKSENKLWLASSATPAQLKSENESSAPSTVTSEQLKPKKESSRLSIAVTSVQPKPKTESSRSLTPATSLQPKPERELSCPSTVATSMELNLKSKSSSTQSVAPASETKLPFPLPPVHSVHPKSEKRLSDFLSLLSEATPPESKRQIPVSPSSPTSSSPSSSPSTQWVLPSWTVNFSSSMLRLPSPSESNNSVFRSSSFVIPAESDLKPDVKCTMSVKPDIGMKHLNARTDVTKPTSLASTVPFLSKPTVNLTKESSSLPKSLQMTLRLAGVKSSDLSSKSVTNNSKAETYKTKTVRSGVQNDALATDKIEQEPVSIKGKTTTSACTDMSESISSNASLSHTPDDEDDDESTKSRSSKGTGKEKSDEDDEESSEDKKPVIIMQKLNTKVAIFISFSCILETGPPKVSVVVRFQWVVGILK